jgi:PST family polysaccharide transporter
MWRDHAPSILMEPNVDFVKAESEAAPLGVRAARGAAALAVGSASGQAIALVTSLVLARLLSPADFGLVAMANLLLAFVGPLHDSGLATAFVARGTHARDYAPTLAWGTVASGLLAAALVAATAPLVARGFEQPALESVTRALAVTFAFRGIAAAPLAVLTRELAFERRAVTTLGGTIVESITSIACAYRGAGAWSLVIGQIGGAGATAALAWLVAPWRPWGTFSAARLWEMSRYGRHVVTANSLGFVGAYLDNIVVGRVLGAGALGLYGTAFRWGRLPATALATIASPIAFPSYVSVRDDPARFHRAYLRLLRTVTSITLPAQTGLFLLAELLVDTLYPPAWHAMAMPLRIFAVFGLVNSIVSTTGDVFKAANRPGWIAALAAVHLPALCVGLWLLVHRGPAGAAAALAVSACASGAVAVPLALHVIALPVGRFLASVVPQALATAAMALVVTTVLVVLAPAPSLAALVLLVVLGALAYVAALAAIDGAWVRELAETVRLTIDRRPAPVSPSRS